MSLKSEQKSRTRRQLIESALELSSQRGFAALSLREVATKAGITPAAFYRHFHDMEELGLAMLDEVGLSLRQMLREARRRVEPGPDAIHISVETFLKFINENQNLFRLLLGERQGASSAFRTAIHNEMDRFIIELAQDLERLQTSIQRPLENYALCAEGIVALTFTLGAEAIDLPRHKQVGLADRMSRHIRTLLRGSRQIARSPSNPKLKSAK